MVKTTPDIMTKPVREAWFLLLCAVVGVIAGLGAVVFRALIALVHNALFYGRLSAFYDANVHAAPSPWGPLIALAPVIAGVCVTFLVTRYAPEAGGTGVPEVLDAIFHRKGDIRPSVPLVKALASSLTIGSGGSAGREGPIMLIGSAFGSALGRMLFLPSWQKIVLVACGAGGGIAATYDTPIGGILFVAEILLREVSLRTIVPLSLATAAATVLGRYVWGAAPQFAVGMPGTEDLFAAGPAVLAAAAGVGVLAGLCSLVFIRAVYRAEDLFRATVPGGPYAKHLAGMLLVGILMYAVLSFSGGYYIEGVGYATVQDALSGRLPLLVMLVLYFVLKLIATSVTLGSGGSGGIFSPALFLGATLGAALASVAGPVLPHGTASPVLVAAGMAAMVGGTTGATTASIVMILEMTRGFGAAVPVTVAVACGIGVRRAFLRESMYTMKLARQGRALSDTQIRDAHDLRHGDD